MTDTQSTERGRQTRMIRLGAGGSTIEVLASPTETGGIVSIYRWRMAPSSRGPSPHFDELLPGAGREVPAFGSVWFAAGVTQDLETVAFESAEAFQAWLDENHAVSPGIWLKLRKKGPGVVALDYAQALEVALCYGWIDGRKAACDDRWWLQRFTPRTARSKWSKINRDKVAALTEQGRMQPSGQAEVDRAKADGRWEAAYDGARTAEVPGDLAAALAAAPAAAEFFETLDRQNRYAILYRVQDAKKAETRARRIEKYVAMLAKGEKLHP